jgi:hypothetical protein
MGSFSYTLKCKLQPLNCLTLIGTEGTAIDGAQTGTGTLTVTAITDAADTIVADDGTGLSSFITGTVAVTLTAQPTLAQLVAINNATGGAITLQITSSALSGSASDLDAAFAGTITEYTGDLTITDAASISQLTNIDDATTGAVNYTAISDLAANLVPAGTVSSYITSNHTVTVQDQATSAQLLAINNATSGAITLNLTTGTLSDTAANLTAAFAGTITDYTGQLTATTTANLAQAEVIFNATSGVSTYAVADLASTMVGAPGSATQMAALQNATSVTVNASSLQGEIDMAGFSGVNEVNLTINGNTQANTITGGDGDDIILAGNGIDQILGGLGNDTITGGSGNDQFVFNTTNTLNGSDTITDFGTGTDTIIFLFGDGGINQADLRGDGTGYLEIAAGGALDANSGVVVITGSAADLTQGTATTIANALTGASADDQFYLVFDNGTDTAIYRVADIDTNAANGFETVELMVTLSGISDADTTLDSSHFVL